MGRLVDSSSPVRRSMPREEYKAIMPAIEEEKKKPKKLKKK